MTQGSSMAEIMLQAMLIMSLAFWMYCFAVVLARVRTIILERERGADVDARALLPHQEQPA